MFPSSIHPYSIIQLQTVDSTNNYAASLRNQSKIQNKTVILASFQSKGKGQLSNKWQSEKDLNLLLTIFLEPKDLNIDHQFALSRLTALAIKDTVTYYLPGSASIKWPNDIFINDKKIAGILIENSISYQKIDYSIIGIGLNINQVKFENISATSFKLENEKEWDRARILEFLLHRFEHYLSMLNSDKNKLHQLFDIHLYKRKEWIQLSSLKSNDFKGMIVGTDKNGYLLVENENQEVKSFQHKEVTFS